MTNVERAKVKKKIFFFCLLIYRSCPCFPTASSSLLQSTMNFQPTDYLTNLNLDFDQEVSPRLNDTPSTTTTNDLDLFSGVEFFDLDVFSNDSSAPSKQQQRLQKDDLSQFLNLPEPKVEANQVSEEVSEQVQPQEEQLIPPTRKIATAAVEDKRKRNTAASARFRIKKKLKEQQMEQHAKELQDRIGSLEKKMKTLEMENKCLKNLILQKNEDKNFDLLESIKKRSRLDSDYQFTT